jgi:hypothetical protein
MRRFFTALLGLLIGYPLFAFAGYWAIALFSGNHFDNGVEASMTAAFPPGRRFIPLPNKCAKAPVSMGHRGLVQFSDG